MNLSQPFGGGSGLAFKRLRELSHRADVPVEGDLALRRRNGSLLKVRPSLNSLFPRIQTRTLPTSRLKGPTYETSTRIQGASGLHHLMGNQWHIMVCTPTPSVSQLLTRPSALQADSLDRKFEKPLRHHLDGYKTVVAVGTPFDLCDQF